MFVAYVRVEVREKFLQHGHKRRTHRFRHTNYDISGVAKNNLIVIQIVFVFLLIVTFFILHIGFVLSCLAESLFLEQLDDRFEHDFQARFIESSGAHFVGQVPDAF